MHVQGALQVHVRVSTCCSLLCIGARGDAGWADGTHQGPGVQHRVASEPACCQRPASGTGRAAAEVSRGHTAKKADACLASPSTWASGSCSCAWTRDNLLRLAQCLPWAPLFSELAAIKDQCEALSSEKAKLQPQLEQARWQGRQLERRIEELSTAKSELDQVHGRP